MGNSAERTDHSTTIDHNVAMMLAQLINDGSPMVRKVRPGTALASSALTDLAENSAHPQAAAPRCWGAPCTCEDSGTIGTGRLSSGCCFSHLCFFNTRVTTFHLLCNTRSLLTGITQCSVSSCPGVGKIVVQIQMFQLFNTGPLI